MSVTVETWQTLEPVQEKPLAPCYYNSESIVYWMVSFVNTGKCDVHVFNLPLELFLHIFSYVPFRERFQLWIVCQSWNRLLIHPVLMQHWKFSGLRGKKWMHALRACFYHATQVFLLDLLHDLTRYLYLRTLSDGKLTSLKCPTMANSWINTEIMIILLHKRIVSRSWTCQTAVRFVTTFAKS